MNSDFLGVNIVSRWALVMFALGSTISRAGQPPPHGTDESPFLNLYAPSITRLLATSERVFQSVDRDDLAKSLHQRLARYNGFSGIDQDSPLGMSWIWGSRSFPHVIFLPATNLDELLKTATFGVVESNQVSAEHYEIRKIGIPYQVCARSDYAYIAEAVSTIAAAHETPDRLRRRLRDQYDLAVHVDLQRIPAAFKGEAVKWIKLAVQPVLQARDDEPPDSANLRRRLGILALDLVEQVILDTSTVTFGVRLNPDNGCLCLELLVEAANKSQMAKNLNGASLGGSTFASFSESDPIANVTLNAVTSDAIEKLLGIEEERRRSPPLDVGLQLDGDGLGNLSLILAFDGQDVQTLNKSLAQILLSLERLRQIELLEAGFDSYHGVTLHSFIPVGLPKVVTDWISSNIEIIVGQGDRTLWIGMGSNEKLLTQLRDAIELVADSDRDASKAPPVRGQALLRKLPEILASNILIPNMDAGRVRDELSKGDDGVSLKLELINNGLKLSIDFEEGFTRLIGRDWIRQVESINRN